MDKYKNIRKLSKAAQNELFARFAKALAKIKSPSEAASFIRDIYTEQEALILARRLQIAELLNEGITYDEVHTATKASHGTIAKVQMWLRTYGDGCRLMIKRMGPAKKEKCDSELGWKQLKRKYPMYFWPEILLNEIIRHASTKEKQRLLKVIGEMREKTKLTKQLLTILE